MHRPLGFSNRLLSFRLSRPKRSRPDRTLRSAGRSRRGVCRLELQSLEPKLALAAVSATSVAVPSAASYAAGQDLVFNVVFSGPMTVVGTPQLDLTIGKAVRPATYVQGSGTNSLAFRYTVQPGEADADGIAVGKAIKLPTGASIVDAGSVPASLGIKPPSTKKVLVDSVAPAVQSVAGPAPKAYPAGSTLSFKVAFSENVFVVGVPTLPVDIGGTVRDAVWDGKRNGTKSLTFNTVVQAGDRDADGVRIAGPIGLSGGAGIRDAAQNAANPAVPPAPQVFPKATVVSKPTYYQRGTLLTPRFQWNANSGYCGETSFISAGMNFGQYTSQWTARSLASPNMSQTNPKSQLLLGKNNGVQNDLIAAAAMKLDAEAFDSGNQKSVRQFLLWVKEKFLAGNVVIIGVLNNTKMLNEWPKDKGDHYYDHIVPVLGIGSGLPLTNRGYHRSDSIMISDNGLYTTDGDGVAGGPPPTNTPYYFTYSFGSFPKTRNQANAIAGPVYALRHRPENFGTAVRGVLDPGGHTIPVRLTSDVNNEGVQNGSGTNQVMDSAPPAFPVTLSAHVTIPDTSKAYNVYLYDDFGNVPTNSFNANAAKANKHWLIPAGSGNSWQTTITCLSSDNRVFRAVPTTAP